jgi:hypothetical protein
MPYRTEWESPAVVVEHNGVTVFRVYKDNHVEEPRTYWFTLDELETSDCSDAAFDVRSLPTWGQNQQTDEHDRIVRTLRDAIESNLLKNP